MSANGLIPAHAGKTRTFGSGHAGRPAHPRACGENSPPCRTWWSVAGSSPRMRGKHPWGVRMSSQLGLIPAHAGKTVA